MKRINIALFSIMLLGVLFSCSKASLDYTQNGNWISRAPFKGVPMAYGASFVLNGIAYVGTGFNPNNPNLRLSSMFKYTPDPITTGQTTGYDSAYGSWSQVADLPTTNTSGKGRSNAIGFSASGKGYIGSGTIDGVTPLSDFYQYDPGANAWAQVTDLGNGIQDFPRVDASAFSFDTTGYVLTGTDYNFYFGDVWKYSPATNTWTSLPDYPGSKRSRAVTWNYGGDGWLITGYTPGSQWAANGNECYDFWKYNPLNGKWSRLRDIFNTNASQTYDDGYTNIVRYYAAAFVIKASPGGNSADKGYITTGSNGGPINFTWEYDFATDLWTQKTPYEGGSRQGAIGFTSGNRGFITTGIAGAQGGNDDLREFFPTQIYNQND